VGGLNLCPRRDLPTFNVEIGGACSKLGKPPWSTGLEFRTQRGTHLSLPMDGTKSLLNVQWSGLATFIEPIPVIKPKSGVTRGLDFSDENPPACGMDCPRGNVKDVTRLR